MATSAPLISLKRIGCFTLLAAGSHLLAGCSKNPESTGKKIADAYCEASAKSDGPRYDIQKELIGELEGGKITTFSQYNTRSSELARPVRRTDSLDAARIKALGLQFELDFPKEEDRSTVRNAMQAHMKQCEQERAEKNKDRPKLDQRLEELRRKLSYK